MKNTNAAADALLVVNNIRERIIAEKEIGTNESGFYLEGNKRVAAAVVASAVTSHTPTTVMTIPEIQAQATLCKKCPLGQTRKNLVFGEGNPNANLVFIGEAPGAEEDEQGIPFVGRAGQLLTKIIEAMKLSRSDVYICNILKCRPPGNRNPSPEEAAACMPLLAQQLNAINPKVICALGAVPAHTLLNTTAPISTMRGKFYNYNGIKFMSTFHPAYLLRNPQVKKSVWDDMQLIMKELGIS